VAIAGQSLSIDLQRSCKNVERHVRLAVSDWLYFLSRLSLSSDTFLESLIVQVCCVFLL
jgi:hypothetical protein